MRLVLPRSLVRASRRVGPMSHLFEIIISYLLNLNRRHGIFRRKLALHDDHQACHDLCPCQDLCPCHELSRHAHNPCRRHHDMSPSGPARFISHPAFHDAGFGAHHPLSIPRHATVLGLCRALDWLEDRDLVTCQQADAQLLRRFHAEDYLEAFMKASAGGVISRAGRQRYGLGTMENPLFPGLWERATATVGGAIMAAQLALEGAIAFHPAGGTHHGRPGRASGFCYFNDPVFSILRLLDGGAARVAYVDLDAHHGDGVQDAFAGDARVLTLSIHEQDRWPYTGRANDRGGGRAYNFPVPAGFNDSELDFLLSEAVAPIVTGFAADAVVITAGADALAGDPLSGLALSNVALWRAVETTLHLAPMGIVLGGGGYNPWTAARAWTGLWGRLAKRPPAPDPLPACAQTILRNLACDLVDDEDVRPDWLCRLEDPPNSGPVRAQIETLVR